MADTQYWMSGGPIKHHRKGWAKAPGVGKRTHYWVEDTTTMPATIHRGRVRFYTSLCRQSAVVDDAWPMLHEGSCPRCANCERKATP